MTFQKKVAAKLGLKPKTVRWQAKRDSRTDSTGEAFQSSAGGFAVKPLRSPPRARRLRFLFPPGSGAAPVPVAHLQRCAGRLHRIAGMKSVGLFSDHTESGISSFSPLIRARSV